MKGLMMHLKSSAKLQEFMGRSSGQKKASVCIGKWMSGRNIL